MRNFLPILYIVCSAFLIGNPFYFAEDILYGDNDPKKDFGVYEVSIGPGTHNFTSWNITLGAIFDRKIGREWPSSTKNYITEHSFLIGSVGYLFFTIKEKNFIPFKRKIKQLNRKKDDYIEKFKFCYLNADSQIMMQILSDFPNIDTNILKGHRFIVIVNAEAIIPRYDIDNVYVLSDEKINTNYEVKLELNNLGTSKWAEFTRRNRGRPVPIVMDNEIISMPYINAEISNGSLYIPGFKSIKEAERFKNQLSD